MIKITEAKQVSRAAATLLYPALDFDIKPCGTYTREDFEQEFANTGGKTYQLNQGKPDHLGLSLDTSNLPNSDEKTYDR